MDEKNKVLLVDDEVDFAQTMAYWLETNGNSVVTANNGPDALKIIRETPPDIVFLDLNMPVMNGVEVLKEIRKINKDLPVIIISAYLENMEMVSEATAYGISGVFHKSKDFQEG
ncbi:MAG: response regulator, partial [Candidatus Omnitrophica bacterium]|nr:response regulator [Candidatus Omnitrophota bacterium]